MLFAQEDLDSLKYRLKQTDIQLSNLASYNFQTSLGAIGYRSRPFDSSKQNEWVQVNFSAEKEIDHVVIVPSIWRDAKKGFQADGFPLSFKVVIGNSANPEGKVVAEYSSKDQLLPRVAPVVVEVEKTSVLWVKIVATELSPRAWDNKYIFQLSEIMIFSGEDNVAIGATLTSPKPKKYDAVGARKLKFLNDGSTPYIMDASGGDLSNSFITRLPVESQEKAKLTIDLGEATELNRIQIHSLEVRDSVPQANRANFGSPKKLRVKGSMTTDFTHAKTILEYQQISIYDNAPIIPFIFENTTCRYLEFTIVEPDFAGAEEAPSPQHFFGFAEIEAFSNGVNILLNKKFQYNFPLPNKENPLIRLTDGQNMFGVILSQREWMNQLALRHTLEAERPVILQKISEKHLERDSHNRLLLWIIGLLVLSTVAYFLINSYYQSQKITDIRERFAADLHDELGANLHAISLLSELAADSIENGDTKEDMLFTVNEIRSTTERSNEAVRYCINSQEARSPLNQINEDMHRIARRMFDSKHYSIEVKGGEIVDSLPLRKRHDFFLFYKECLVNISRHSHSDSFHVRLSADTTSIQLTVTDNGVGSIDSIPSSLKRRAKILKAKLDIESPMKGSSVGMKVQLTLPVRGFLNNIFSN